MIQDITYILFCADINVRPCGPRCPARALARRNNDARISAVPPWVCAVTRVTKADLS